MEKTAPKFNDRLLLVVSAVLLLIALYLGYRVLTFSGESHTRQAGKITDLEKRLAAIEGRLEALFLTVSDANQNLSFQGSVTPPDPSTRKNDSGIRKAVDENKVELEKIKKILASTGVEQLAEGDDIDPELLSSIYSEYAERSRVSKYRQSMIEKNAFQHQQDEGLFDAYLNELYKRARPRRGTNADSQDSDAAFAEMLDQYPDAYATAMVTAERAFAAMRSQNPANVESYYAMLQEHDSDIANAVVTDRGIEAMPNIELYLARHYLRDGREEEAVALIQSLESNYADSLVFTAGRGRGRRWMTVLEALDWINSTR